MGWAEGIWYSPQRQALKLGVFLNSTMVATRTLLECGDWPKSRKAATRPNAKPETVGGNSLIALLWILKYFLYETIIQIIYWDIDVIFF